MSSADNSAVLPGDLINVGSGGITGFGVHTHKSQLHASTIGALHVSKASGTDSASAVSIMRSHRKPLLPEVNDTILARITRLTPRNANCVIIAIYQSLSHQHVVASSDNPIASLQPVAIPNQSQFSGQIRAQDVRATEKDKVVISDAFRVGDIVRAVVISLGDQRDYYLSTSGNENGVILAWASNENGEPGTDLLEPISWQEMRNKSTGQKEKRKVAKPV